LNGAYFTTRLLYVNDIILDGDSHQHEIKLIKSYLDQQFCIKDLGNQRFFLI